MNKLLEKKIVDKMYTLETRRTTVSLLTKTIILTGAAFITIIIGQILLELINDHQLIGLSRAVSEDTELFPNILKLINIYRNEIPTPLIEGFIVGILICTGVLTVFILNFGTLKNKMISIVAYWKKTRK